MSLLIREKGQANNARKKRRADIVPFIITGKTNREP